MNNNDLCKLRGDSFDSYAVVKNIVKDKTYHSNEEKHCEAYKIYSGPEFAFWNGNTYATIHECAFKNAVNVRQFHCCEPYKISIYMFDDGSSIVEMKQKDHSEAAICMLTKDRTKAFITELEKESIKDGC